MQKFNFHAKIHPKNTWRTCTAYHGSAYVTWKRMYFSRMLRYTINNDHYKYFAVWNEYTKAFQNSAMLYI